MTHRDDVAPVVNVVQFRCPKCGAEMLSETGGGAVNTSPPTCRVFHTPTEMEQVYLGADAFRRNHGGTDGAR